MRVGQTGVFTSTAPARRSPGGPIVTKGDLQVAHKPGDQFKITKIARTKTGAVYVSGGQYWYYGSRIHVGKTTLHGTPLPADVVWDDKAKVAFRGHETCSCVTQVIGLAEAFLIEEKVIQHSLDFWQFGYNIGGVAASAGTHDLGGVADSKQHDDKTIAAIRRAGGAGWLRDKQHGDFDTVHCHFVVVGCPHAAPLAQSQVRSYRAGRDGLAGNGPDYGPKVSPIRTYKAAIAALTKG